MSDEQNTFMKELKGDFSDFKEELKDDFKDFKGDVRHEYDRMRAFLLSIIGILLASIITIAFTHLRQDGETRTKVATLEATQKNILEKAASKQSIQMLITTFDNYTSVTEKFFPDNIKEGIQEMNRLSNDLRKEIMAKEAGITTGSEGGSDAGQN